MHDKLRKNSRRGYILMAAGCMAIYSLWAEKVFSSSSTIYSKIVTGLLVALVIYGATLQWSKNKMYAEEKKWLYILYDAFYALIVVILFRVIIFGMPSPRWGVLLTALISSVFLLGQQYILNRFLCEYSVSE